MADGRELQQQQFTERIRNFIDTVGIELGAAHDDVGFFTFCELLSDLGAKAYNLRADEMANQDPDEAARQDS